MLAIRAMIAWRPAKTPPTSTGFANKEEATIMAGATNPDHHSKVIRITIPIIILVIIQIIISLESWC
jgi:hypothetical protein